MSTKAQLETELAKSEAENGKLISEKDLLIRQIKNLKKARKPKTLEISKNDTTPTFKTELDKATLIIAGLNELNAGYVLRLNNLVNDNKEKERIFKVLRDKITLFISISWYKRIFYTKKVLYTFFK